MSEILTQSEHAARADRSSALVAMGTASVLRRSLRQPRMQLGLLLTGFIVLVAIFGPLFAPHSPAALLDAPYSAPTASTPLGTDYLGQDVLSRVLYGGRSVVWMSVAAATFGVGLGTAIGLVAGFSRSWLDDFLMRLMDVFLAFPALVLVLLSVSIVGPKPWLIALVVGLAWMPQSARVARGATVEVVTRDFVASAEAIGVPRMQIIRQEVLPNIITPVMVEFGLKLTWSIAVVAAISFLGDGLQPPAADWGLMIQQNRQGLTLQPWGVVAPILCIVIFAVGTNLMTEGFARTVANLSQRQPRS